MKYLLAFALTAPLCFASPEVSFRVSPEDRAGDIRAALLQYGIDVELRAHHAHFSDSRDRLRMLELILGVAEQFNGPKELHARRYRDYVEYHCPKPEDRTFEAMIAGPHPFGVTGLKRD